MKRLFLMILGLCLWMPLQAKEVTISHNDLNLRANLQLAEGKTLEDGVVLMLHGTLAHNRMEIMSTLAELLNEEGQSTLAINLSYSMDKRDSAMLDCAIEHRHKHTDAMAEVAVWMSWLKEQGAKKVTLLGHSRGGNQIVWYAKEHDNDLIQKVVTIAPATYNKEQRAANYKERYKTELAPLYEKAKALVEAGKGDELMDAGFVYCADAKASAASFVDYYQDNSKFDTPHLLADMPKPTLVVTGEEDTVVKGLPEALSQLKADNVQHVDIEEADHFFRDLYADSVVEAILEFESAK